MSDPVKYHFPGLNKSSPDHPLAVRHSDGTDFIGQESELALHIQSLQLEATELLLVEQRITNLHLAKLTGEYFTELDIESKG